MYLYKHKLTFKLAESTSIEIMEESTEEGHSNLKHVIPIAICDKIPEYISRQINQTQSTATTGSLGGGSGVIIKYYYYYYCYYLYYVLWLLNS